MIFSSFYSYSQEKSAEFFLAKRGEVYFSFELPSSSELKQLVNFMSVDRIEHDVVYAYANQNEFEKFLKFQIDYNVLGPPGKVEFDLNMKSVKDFQAKDSAGNWDFYPTYEAYEEIMYQFEEDYPDLCQIINLKTLPSGRKLLFAKITSDIEQMRPLPRFMYTSTMHGDETVGYILSLRLIDHLLKNYNNDTRITQMLDNMEIWINPLENPDGTYTDDNSSVNDATRGNANNVDLNRNYPKLVEEPEDPPQPETKAMINLVDSLSFVMSANMHSGVELVNFAFDSWESSENKHADHNWWYNVSRQYADTAQAFSPDGYMTDMDNGVTHGGDWYVIYGSRMDYMNYYAHCRETTLELSDSKVLEPEYLPDYWEYNYRSLLNYIEQANYGINGIVTDEQGLPLKATILIEGHDTYYSVVYSSAEYGDFYRPLPEGTYDITFIHDYFPDKTINNVSLNSQESKFLEVNLGERLSTHYYNNAYLNDLKIFPNPAREILNITADKSFKNIHIFDLIGNKVFFGQFEGKSATIDVSGFSSGYYFLKVYFSDMVVIENVAVY